MTATDLVVIDANVAIDLASRGLLEELGPRFAAPTLLLAETRSVLHQQGARTSTLDYSRELQRRIEAMSLSVLDDPRQHAVAWDIADQLQWQKTYDAEYLAAAHVHRLPLATYDRRLANAALVMGIPVARLP